MGYGVQKIILTLKTRQQWLFACRTCRARCSTRGDDFCVPRWQALGIKVDLATKGVGSCGTPGETVIMCWHTFVFGDNITFLSLSAEIKPLGNNKRRLPMLIRSKFHQCLTQNFIKHMQPGNKKYRCWRINYGDEPPARVLMKLRLTLAWVTGSDALTLHTDRKIINRMSYYFKKYDKKTYKAIKRRHYKM